MIFFFIDKKQLEHFPRAIVMEWMRKLFLAALTSARMKAYGPDGRHGAHVTGEEIFNLKYD